MDDREYARLEANLSQEVEAAMSSFESRLRAVHDTLSAQGRLRSGQSVRLAIEAMGFVADRCLTRCTQRLAVLGGNAQSYGILRITLSGLLDLLEEQLPDIERVVGMLPNDDGSPSDITLLAARLFGEMRVRIESKVEANAAQFDTHKASSEAHSPSPPSPNYANKVESAVTAGRLPAEWWDDLWVEMCRQIYLGELLPRSQADIVRAMLVWLETKGIDVSEATLKPRARKLFAMLEKAKID